MDDTRLAAHLPTAEIEISRQTLPEHNGERILIRITATPSFDAVSRWLLQASVFPLAPALTLWTDMMLRAWQPWLPLAPQALRTLPSAEPKRVEAAAQPSDT
jgi:hypothetical protein